MFYVFGSTGRTFDGTLEALRRTERRQQYVQSEQ